MPKKSESTELGEFEKFIQRQLNERQMSAREFARFTDTSHELMNRYLSGDSRQPNLETIMKIARATKTDPRAIFELFIPDDLKDIHPSSEDRLLSRQIQKLSPEIRSAIDALLLGAALLNSESTDQ